MLYFISISVSTLCRYFILFFFLRYFHITRILIDVSIRYNDFTRVYWNGWLSRKKKETFPSIFYTMLLRSREETSSTISVCLRVRKYEAATATRPLPPPSPFHRWDKSMLHEFTADELARSFHEITRYKPIPVDSPRFVNHRPFRFLPSLLVPPPRRETQLLSFRPTK